MPLIVYSTLGRNTESVLPTTFSFVNCDNPAIIVDTIKPAEEGGATILRLYEAYGSHATGILTFGADVECAGLTNLLEEPIEDSVSAIDVVDNTIRLTLRPFEVTTIKLNVVAPPGELFAVLPI